MSIYMCVAYFTIVNFLFSCLSRNLRLGCILINIFVDEKAETSFKMIQLTKGKSSTLTHIALLAGHSGNRYGSEISTWPAPHPSLQVQAGWISHSRL